MRPENLCGFDNPPKDIKVDTDFGFYSSYDKKYTILVT